MGTKLGVLIPTREQILNDTDDAGALLRLADAAEDLAFDSVWVGDSTIARPRHEPLTLLSAVAGRTRRVSLGTARSWSYRNATHFRLRIRLQRLIKSARDGSFSVLDLALVQNRLKPSLKRWVHRLKNALDGCLSHCVCAKPYGPVTGDVGRALDSQRRRPAASSRTNRRAAHLGRWFGTR